MADKNLIGRCGLYCGACAIFRAYKDKGEYLQRVAKFFRCPPEKVKCEGCQALTPDCWGTNCDIVNCLETKGFEFCYQCFEFSAGSCEKYERLAEGYLKEDHISIRTNLERIKAGDAEDWLIESKRKFSCPQCGKPLSTHSRITKCYHCDAELTI